MLAETDIKNIYKKKDGEEDTNQVALVSDTKKEWNKINPLTERIEKNCRYSTKKPSVHP